MPRRSSFLSIALIGLAIVYLIGHAVAGRNGIAASVSLQEREARLVGLRDQLAQERARLQTRAERLKARLDLDYLDERARIALGAAAPGELIFARADLLPVYAGP